MQKTFFLIKFWGYYSLRSSHFHERGNSGSAMSVSQCSWAKYEQSKLIKTWKWDSLKQESVGCSSKKINLSKTVCFQTDTNNRLLMVSNKSEVCSPLKCLTSRFPLRGTRVKCGCKKNWFFAISLSLLCCIFSWDNYKFTQASHAQTSFALYYQVRWHRNCISTSSHTNIFHMQQFWVIFYILYWLHIISYIVLYFVSLFDCAVLA